MKAHPLIVDKGIAIPLLENLEQVADQIDQSDPEILPFFEEEAAGELEKIQGLLQAWHMEEAGCPCPLADLRVRWHTLKGAANSVGQLRIGSLAGGLKDLLDAITGEQAIDLRSELTKVTILVVEAIKILLREAHAPQYNHARKEQILQAIRSILSLRQKSAAMLSRP